MITVIKILCQLFTLLKEIVLVLFSFFEIYSAFPTALRKFYARSKELASSLISFNLIIFEIKRWPVTYRRARRLLWTQSSDHALCASYGIIVFGSVRLLGFRQFVL